MRKSIVPLLAIICIHSFVYAQNVSIPDDKFVEALIELGVDTGGDSLISFSEAEDVTNLRLINGITDMTGIEAFVNLDSLYCNGQRLLGTPGNSVSRLDVSSNLSLKYLECGYNPMDTLIIGNNDNLLELSCFANQLTELDVSGCLNLRILSCGGNPLLKLNLSTNTSLEILVLEEIFSAPEICVWSLPFPTDGVTVYGEEAGEFHYRLECIPPVLTILTDSLFQPDIIEFSLNEDGVVYHVDNDTVETLDEIRLAALDSVSVQANINSSFDLSEMDNSKHWIVAVDALENISEFREFTVYGVGLENKRDIDLIVYPNPIKDLLTICTSASGRHTLTITNLTGQLVFSTHYYDNALTINLSEFEKGVFFLRLTVGANSVTRKVIKL